MIQVLEYVDAVLRIQHVQTRRIREVPPNLGRNRAAATQVTIDLPEVELIEVAVATQIPIRTLTRVRDESVATLESLTHQGFKTDVRAWKKWWASQEPRDR